MALEPAFSPEGSAVMGTDAVLAAWRERIAQAAEWPLPPHIPALLDAAAARYPSQTLLDFFETGKCVTYAELADRSRRIAVQLQARGLRPGMCMAVMLPNGPHWHVLWFAALRLGLRVLPINPGYTPRELQYVLSDAQANAWWLPAERSGVVDTLVPYPQALRRDWVFTAADGETGDSDWHTMLQGEASPSLAPEPALEADTVANIQYTSGTTGFPKGCILTHGYWLNLVQGTRLMLLQPMKRFFTAQPFFYMDPFWQLLMTIDHGGTLTVARKISGRRLLSWLVDHAIEWAQLPEIALKSADAVAGRALALRQVFTFGWSETSRRDFVARFGVPATESFGMTEIGLGLAMPPEWDAADHPTSVGIPFLRRDARIVDEEGREVGPDIPGELQIRGPYMFRGYFNNPQANAGAFDGEWFRTGDTFVRDAQGFYRIVGRFKDMIRRSSENIAAREVEAVVRALVEVLDCAAVPVKDAQRGEEVKIMIQLHPHLLEGGVAHTAVLSPDRLFAHCMGALAPFKVPRYVQFVDGFPRTSSNKIAKHLIAGPAIDGRMGAYDRQTKTWVGVAGN